MPFPLQRNPDGLMIIVVSKKVAVTILRLAFLSARSAFTGSWQSVYIKTIRTSAGIVEWQFAQRSAERFFSSLGGTKRVSFFILPGSYSFLSAFSHLFDLFPKFYPFVLLLLTLDFGKHREIKTLSISFFFPL